MQHHGRDRANSQESVSLSSFGKHFELNQTPDGDSTQKGKDARLVGRDDETKRKVSQKGKGLYSGQPYHRLVLRTIKDQLVKANS
jgi:hypothetical protein